MTPKEKLIQWQPKAVNICDAGGCHECDHDTMLFYQLPEMNPIKAGLGYVQGGFWCSNCGWGNSGAMPIDDFVPDENGIIW